MAALALIWSGATARSRTILSFLALLFALGGGARADFYVFSVQQTSGYVITGASVAAISSFSLSSAAQTAGATPPGGESQVGTLDAPQSYVGPAAGRPAENFFGRKGQVDADYARGDALITPAPGFSTSSVAEAWVAGSGNSASR